MSQNFIDKNNILSKISVAARSTLSHPKSIELAHLIGAGPSIRARARLALAAAFLVAAPTLLIGVMRTETVAEHAATLSEYDDYWKDVLEVKIALKEVSLSIWSYSVEPEIENRQGVLDASEYLKQVISRMIIKRPPGLDLGPKGYFEGLANRLDLLIKRAIGNRATLDQARLNIISIAKELKNVEKRVIKIATKERNLALGTLSAVGRDQLILFLVLIFAIPVFVGLVPGWLVTPLTHLRQIASKIDMGQIKEIAVHGKDEVAVLARSLKSYFLKREELDQKKSSKIFEMRNLLRSVISKVDEPVFIIDNNLKINYINNSGAELIGLPSHRLEGKLLFECIFAQKIKEHSDKAFSGDVNEEAINESVEFNDGRIIEASAKIGMVRNRDGEVSRVVIVFAPIKEIV